jgi:hypothetical protein
MNMNLNEKEVTKTNRKIDLSGFQMKDELNPKIWDKDQKMKPEVKKTLLKIADDYFESLEIPGVDIEDVTMTGSLANYNWSKYSDVDLHIVVDYEDIPVDKDLVQDFLKSKSSNWNKEHDITIYGYDIEIYVQDINEIHHSTGVYSILNNEWKIKPEKKKITVNDKSVRDKANMLMDRIEDLYDELIDGDYNVAIKGVDKLTEKIKKMRQSGLESGGEFSNENMVFKVLRRNGMMDRLYDIKTVAYDKEMTLESIQESKKIDALLESIEDSPFKWIKDTNPTPIISNNDDYNSHYKIVLDYFNQNPILHYGGWKYAIDSHTGSVEWWKDGENDFIFWATPFWDGGSSLPIDYQADMGDYDTVNNIDLPEFHYKEELIEWLQITYPQIVHEEIKKYTGPLAESVENFKR